MLILLISLLLNKVHLVIFVFHQLFKLLLLLLIQVFIVFEHKFVSIPLDTLPYLFNRAKNARRLWTVSLIVFFVGRFVRHLAMTARFEINNLTRSRLSILALVDFGKLIEAVLGITEAVVHLQVVLALHHVCLADVVDE